MFHTASLNVVDTRYLHTLPLRELRAGMGELVKNGLVLGGQQFTMAERMLDAHTREGIDDAIYTSRLGDFMSRNGGVDDV